MSREADLYATIWEDSSVTVFARIKANTGSYITQATLSSITCAVYEVPSGDAVATPSVVIASTVFDTLQTTSDDARWTEDSTGFNFRYTLAAANFPSGPARYRAEFKFTPTSGDPYWFVSEVHTKRIYTS